MTASKNKEPLLSVKGLKQYFKVSSSYTVHAVEDVSFEIYPGETYGLVGNPDLENPRSEEVLSGFMIRRTEKLRLTGWILAER